MRKLLILAGIFTVLAYNAQARYYEEDGYYYEEQPRYERQVRYRDEPRYTRQKPHFRRVSAEDERNYNERRYMENTTNNIRPYIGVDVATSSLKFENDDKESFNDTFNTYDFKLGAKFNKFFEVETFYQQSSTEANTGKIAESGKTDGFIGDFTYNYDYTTKLKYKAFGVDVIGNIPISQSFEILSALGIGFYNFDTGKNLTSPFGNGESTGIMEALGELCTQCVKSGIYKKKINTTGVRIGLGAQYNINEHIALRAMARYIKLTDDDIINSLTEFSLGLRYMF